MDSGLSISCWPVPALLPCSRSWVWCWAWPPIATTASGCCSSVRSSSPWPSCCRVRSRSTGISFCCVW
uniref:Putative secreted protein n=1 Tax=Anopheles darlingi TaxID=43151 RepID=A0A2M4D2V4_ANODA